jgi:hypothetical protein
VWGCRESARCKRPRELIGGKACILGQREPAGEAPAQLEAAEPLGDDLGCEEIALDEIAQPRADAIFAPRQDRRVGDGQTERMAEERRHREPVGKSAHHRRLAARAQQQNPESRLRNEPCGEEKCSSDDEQTGRQQPVPAQSAPLLLGSVEKRDRWLRRHIARCGGDADRLCALRQAR